MDKVVQKAIYMVLEAIYEPWFDKTNRSFGFRSHKECHDAIYCLTNKRNIGMIYAIEGDIEGASNKVQKGKLIAILSKRLMIENFLN
jgi:retron-type reverse transcriptase